MEVLRAEGLAGFAIRLLQWSGIYRRLILAAGPHVVRTGSPRIASECEQLDPSEVDEYLAIRPDQDRASTEGRLASGDLCFVARHEGRIVGATWAALGSVWIDYLGCEIRIAADAAYNYDTYVDPEYRGLRVADALAKFRGEFLRRSGRERAVGFFWPENRVANQRRERRGINLVGELIRYRIGPWRRYVLRLEADPANPAIRLVPRKRSAVLRGTSVLVALIVAISTGCRGVTEAQALQRSASRPPQPPGISGADAGGEQLELHDVIT
jgi:GNAT superfamily N-acetyltransferase